MKKLILLFTICSAIHTLVALPSEVYVAYQLKDGEKVKEIAERFHVPFHKLVAYNKQWQTDGIKPGITVRIPTEHIKKVVNIDNEILYENKNSFSETDSLKTVTEQDINIARELQMISNKLYVNINVVNLLLTNLKSSRPVSDIEIIFSDGTSTTLSSAGDELNLLSSLRRNSFVSNNMNLAFDRK
jgi:LysM repeat protein